MRNTKWILMGLFTTKPADFLRDADDGQNAIIKNEKFDTFDSEILGLGDIGTSSKSVRSLAVIFDLEGFTNFCKQIDPNLVVPEFLNLFLDWIFDSIKKLTIEEKVDGGYAIYSNLPFFSKFMGDGILFIWETEEMDEVSICNVIVMLNSICNKYKSAFLPSISDKITSPPSKLRCGIARGTVYSVGNGQDFVGPCINVAARLQKLSNLSFALREKALIIKKT